MNAAREIVRARNHLAESREGGDITEAVIILDRWLSRLTEPEKCRLRDYFGQDSLPVSARPDEEPSRA